ncbi:DegV family protein [Metallumcola ferriviriculae]|uniref:DegV family protein n=1 Tax=Metallumcola ferriviriculae TaxID=3039180 RepID=A0AAU0ULY1_9FIRM|nr:DegV family protein [Desulfitibacteraceae bacterium MK1]
MNKIALVTDSTADLPKDYASRLNINVVPLKILFGQEAYLDGVDLTPDQFFSKLETSPILPQSSQPSPSQFAAVYESLLKKYSDIISIHVSSNLSGTINSALAAKEKLQAKIHIVDSASVTLGIGLQIAEAVQCIKDGLDAPTIIKRISKARQNTEVLFALDTLKYLTKGGRVGKLSGLAGSILNIKPIGRISEDGNLAPFLKARSQRKALDSMVKSFKEFSHERKTKAVRIAVGHARAADSAVKLRESLENLFGVKTTIFTEVGSVVGTHAGPGTVGAAVQYE